MLLALILNGCSPTRFLAKDEALVKKVKIEGIDQKYQEQIYSYVQKDIRPNSWFKLALYNLVNTKNGRYRTDRIKNIGEAPHILDSTLVEISRTQIEKYLKTKGFFNADVTDSIAVKDKKAYITFLAERGPMFRVRNFTYDIPDTAVKRIFEESREPFSRIKPGKRFDTDSIMYEINSTYQLMKQNGYYDFQRGYIHADVDSNLSSSQADIVLNIYNPPNRENHKVYTIDDSYITILRNSARPGRRPADSAVVDSQYHFKDHSLRFKPKALSRYIYFDKGDIYNIDNENLTYDRLYELNVFKNIKIEYTKTSDSSALNPRIEAIPLKKMSNRIEGEYTFNSGRNGFNIGNTYTNRNVFGGAEQLEVKFRYGILYDTRSNGGNLFTGVFNRDFQMGATLSFPKLLLPFRTSQTGINGMPRTILSSSFQMFDQLNAFSSRIFINSITYNWFETKYKLHGFTPISLEYRDGRFDPAFRDTLEERGYEYYIRVNGQRTFGLGSLYSFTYNGLRLNTYDNFIYFRGQLDLAGNTLGLLGQMLNLRTNSNGEQMVGGLPYLQYGKTELDFRWYRSLGNEQQFVARINPGVGLPYGNSDFLPFEKNFYAGGSNGIRAWQARTLGPGNYNREELMPAERKSLRNLDQLGEIKLEANLEYRFKLLNDLWGAKLRGAAFTDFGNIWRMPKKGRTLPGEFRLDRFADEIAIGTGFGLRFDVDYFVFRFDVGVKVKDPQFPDDPWVIKHLFTDKKDFQRDFYNTHYPDQYRFLQYNFGIGMPF